MRRSHTTQHSIFDFYPEHDLGSELKLISHWLDKHPDLVGWVTCDTSNLCEKASGRRGFTAETLLRCALLMQTRQLTYEELKFSLVDSLSSQTFARLDRKESAFSEKVNLAKRYQSDLGCHLGSDPP